MTTDHLVQTRRLRLREFTHDDLDDLAAMVADPEQMTFYPRPKTHDEASRWVAGNVDLYRERGFGIWFLESLPTSRFAGYCGIRPLELDGASETEIGWHVNKALWNQGIASEAATAARDLAFERFDVPRLVALIHPEHVASRRVAENIGMRVERETVLEEDYPALVYALGAAGQPEGRSAPGC